MCALFESFVNASNEEISLLKMEKMVSYTSLYVYVYISILGARYFYLILLFGCRLSEMKKTCLYVDYIKNS